jgi:hypothetical protein
MLNQLRADAKSDVYDVVCRRDADVSVSTSPTVDDEICVAPSGSA